MWSALRICSFNLLLFFSSLFDFRNLSRDHRHLHVFFPLIFKDDSISWFYALKMKDINLRKFTIMQTNFISTDRSIPNMSRWKMIFFITHFLKNNNRMYMFKMP